MYHEIYATDKDGNDNLAINCINTHKTFSLKIPEGKRFLPEEYKFVIDAKIDYKLLWRDLKQDSFFGKKLEHGLKYTIRNDKSEFTKTIRNMRDVFCAIPKIEPVTILDGENDIRTFFLRAISVKEDVVGTEDGKNISITLQDNFKYLEGFYIKATGLLEDIS